MDVRSKKMAFDMNAEYTKVTEVFNSTFESLLECYFPLPEDLFFELHLRRTSVLEDTFEQLAYDGQSRMPLAVRQKSHCSIVLLCSYSSTCDCTLLICRFILMETQKSMTT